MKIKAFLEISELSCPWKLVCFFDFWQQPWLRIQLLERVCGPDLSLQLLGHVPLHRSPTGSKLNVNVIRKRLDSPHPSGLLGLLGSILQQVLNWGMIIAASMRSTLQASMETNEAGKQKVAATKS